MSSVHTDPRTGETLVELMGRGELPDPPPPATPAELSRRPGQEPRAPSAAPRRVRSLSVVIPARDETENLPGLLQELQEVLAGLPLQDMEVVLVDDGSRDGTAAVAESWGARVISHAESLGNGAAVKRGIREARNEWVLLLDGDGQHPPASIPAMVDLAERYDMVVGSRGGSGGIWYRNIANRTYNRLASYVTNRKIPDLTSGFRMLRADVAKGFVYLLPNTFSYPTTITLALLRGGYSVGFHPIRVRERRGRSHISIVRDGTRFFLIILRITTFFAPLRVFLPLSAIVFLLGVCWYLYTWFTAGRFTNMAVLLISQATVLFALGLISEQVAALRFERGDDSRGR